ncbi:MAG TPA: hypothetical protein VF131_07945 [Blastocatellia bacterium]|nr:hypothetical protein [Blastocatellia bacterium]
MKRSRIDKSLRRLRRRRDDPEKTRAYTPGEIHRLAHESTNNAGIIRPNTEDMNLPSGLDNLGEGQQTDHPSRVVLVIVMLALIFIAIIAYFVSQMPDTKETGGQNRTEQNLIEGRD